MPKFIDETGNGYGRLTVLRRATKEETSGRLGGVYWLCSCSCGNYKVICGTSLRNGETRSCGCYSASLIADIGKKLRKVHRIGESNTNYQGCTMYITEYRSSNDISVKFVDKFGATVHSDYKGFKSGSVKNPYYPDVYGVGCVGLKYKSVGNLKAYKVWHGIMQRCYDLAIKQRQPTYMDCTIDKGWMVFENFYDWVKSQPNYDKWLVGNRWMVDKDILVKGNKHYGPDTCCLVPEHINTLFTKRQNDRGKYPIGVCYNKRDGVYRAQCNNPFLNKRECVGRFDNPDDAFLAYKSYKEQIIKKIAEIEYASGNISEACYDAMINYVVEHSD